MRLSKQTKFVYFLQSENIHQFEAPCGIIYCRTRQSVERVAAGLCKQNIVAKAYHAGLNDKDRKQVQEDWTSGQFRVICATISFGMGVDKSSVRFVVHWDVPQNIAAYYQESGRAGRDGKLSYCRVYFCREEVKSINFILNMSLQKNSDNAKAKRSVKEFEKLVEHCESLRCRHLLFSQYFGDATPDCKKRQLCDVCKDMKKTEKKLDEFHRLGMNSFNSKMDYDFNDSSDLYEGGRNTMQENAASYHQEDDDESGSSSTSARDKKAGKNTTNPIQKELERRRQKLEAVKKLEATQTRSNGIRIKSSIHTSKIQGLDVKKRESYLDFLVKLLRENVVNANEKPAHDLKGCDFEDIAAELEYNCFTNNRTSVMYTKSFTNERLRIGKCTKNNQLLPEIENHSPKKRSAHGGSAEAMQQDLDAFMKKHNIENERSEMQPNVNVNVNTNTNTNVGFQTARQINNRLKEPNRMKKDPLTQTSINSFFTAGSIKREPEEEMDTDDNDPQQQNDNQPDAKRRKIDDTNENTPVKFKDEPVEYEPMETCEYEHEQRPIKSEPRRYDANADTDSGDSDDEEPNVQNESTEVVKVKKEPGLPNEIPQQNPFIKSETVDDEPINIKTEPGLSQQTDPPTVPLTVPQTQMPFEESMEFQEQEVKDEPQDDAVFSGEETDEEPSMSKFNQHIEHEIQHHRTNRLHENLAQFYDDQEPSTSHSNQELTGSSSFESSSTPFDDGLYGDNMNEDDKWSENDRFSENVRSSENDRSSTNELPPNVNIPEPRSQHTTTADGKPLSRLNKFWEVEENPIMNHIINIDDDDFDIECLGDVMEQYTQDLEKETKEERERLQNLIKEELSQSEYNEVMERLHKLQKMEKLRMNLKSKKLDKARAEEKVNKRDLFIREVFGPGFDAQEYEKLLDVGTHLKPSTSRSDSKNNAKDTKDIKQKVTYSDIIGKPKLETNKGSTIHQVSLTLNEHIQLAQNAHKLESVPKKAIEIVRDHKTTIKQKVERYLMPYYTDGSLNKTQYEKVCQRITNDRYEANDFDSESIKKKVVDLVGQLLLHLKNSKSKP